MAKQIVCIGDSNTWGYDPRGFGGGRYPAAVRWTACPNGLSTTLGKTAGKSHTARLRCACSGSSSKR